MVHEDDELEDLLLEIDCMTPDVVRGAAIAAAIRLGAPAGAISNLIGMRQDKGSEWNLSWAFLDDEDWLDSHYDVFIDVMFKEKERIISRMVPVDALMAQQECEVWAAWEQKAAKTMEITRLYSTQNEKGDTNDRVPGETDE